MPDETDRCHTFICLPEIAENPDARLIFESFSHTISVASSREIALKEAQAVEPAVEVLVIGVKEVIGTDELETYPQLKVLATLSGGVNHINQDALRARHIDLVAIPGVNAQSVAEHALMLMLGLSKQVLDGHRSALEGIDRDGLPTLPHELAGTEVGILGAGYTARRLITLLRSFSCGLLVHTRNPDRHRDLEDVEFVALDELFARSPRTSIHVPLTRETEALVGYDLLSSMRADPVVVNCSRVEIFDLPGVLAALGDRSDLRLGVDAFGIKHLPLAEYSSQCLFSPHIAGVTHESLYAMHVALAEAVAETLSDRHGT